MFCPPPAEPTRREPRFFAGANILNSLGTLAYNRDHDDEAEADFRQTLAIWRTVYGDHHQFVGLSYANMAGVYMDRKDYPDAEDMGRRSLAVYRETLPPEHRYHPRKTRPHPFS